MIQTPQIAYRARDDATPESEVSVLASIYKLAIGSSQAKRKTSGVASLNGGVATVKNDEEVSHVNRQTDKGSRIVITY